MLYNHSMNTLPLFPLNTVLFPGQLLPLHIFEPRYRQMIGECLQNSQPFGVVLLRQGDEVGDDAAVPYDVGTTANIIQVERLPDGRMTIVCVGNARFRVTQTYHDRPYLRGDVDLWPWLPLDTNRPSPADVVRQRLQRYLNLLAQISHSPINVDIPDDAATLANLSAAVLQIDPDEKQQLLATASIGELLDQVAAILQRELRGLSIMQAARQKPTDESPSFSLN
jgi:Lon protease-like protein